jgi:hypothetical protein
MSNRYLVHMRNTAQRWFKFHNVGQSPQDRSGHAMASDGTRIFVVGGCSNGADDTSLIHVFDTSMYCTFFFDNLSGRPFNLRIQSTSSTRNPSVTLPIPMRGHPTYAEVIHRSPDSGATTAPACCAIGAGTPYRTAD